MQDSGTGTAESQDDEVLTSEEELARAIAMSIDEAGNGDDEAADENQDS